MKISEFIEEYKKNPEVGRKKLNVKKYLPIEVKEVIIEQLIENILEKDGFIVTYNSILRHVSFLMTTISAYTDLECHTLEDYNLLAESELLQDILSLIPEYDIFLSMFEMRFDDYIRDKNTLNGLMSQGFQELLSAFNSSMELISEKIDGTNMTELISFLKNYKG